ncbi:hypothetical protein ACIRSU_16925 [Streptomyces sp. NPDC101160]|uniref:hypothetical protein n=1 Tax=Streptomyces sp. NPDC101160 TaxID=3366118 RepID=UPI0038242202
MQRVSNELPEGWTIERVRAEAADPEAVLLSLDRLVVIEEIGRTDYTSLVPDIILALPSFNMSLARVDSAWYLGDLEPDGSIICWAAYGTDLGTVIRGL